MADGWVEGEQRGVGRENVRVGDKCGDVEIRHGQGYLGFWLDLVPKPTSPSPSPSPSLSTRSSNVFKTRLDSSARSYNTNDSPTEAARWTDRASDSRL